MVTLQPVQNFQAPPLQPPSNSNKIPLHGEPGHQRQPGADGSVLHPGILNWPLNVTMLIGTAAYRNEF